ncbi:hypothetical protein RUM8411_04146 [Ruegeria meonggei]|uniref:Uncharacterized protein n=1 Tax=Ruegeria meonggei TaxID=1446476 RepID=A0A1X7ABJ9_9RHOB|nr:hypothetical protein RUM8411_04146 [Ruegeria meonggei]
MRSLIWVRVRRVLETVRWSEKALRKPSGGWFRFRTGGALRAERAESCGVTGSVTDDQQNGGQRQPEGWRKRAARFAGGKPLV